MNRVAILATGSLTMSKKIKNCEYVFKEIQYHINFKDVEYTNGTLSQSKFFQIIDEKKEIPQTSQPSPQMIRDLYEEKLKKYDILLVVAPSQKLSGTYQGCLAVAKDLNEERKENCVHVIETSGIAFSECYVIENIIDMLSAKVKLEEIIKAASTIKGDTYAFTTDSEFLKLSGRVSGTKALLISLLNIRPIILMKAFEKPEVVDKGRGFKFIKRYITNNIINKEKEQRIYFSQMLMDEMEKEQILEVLESSNVDYEILDDADIVVCTHFGPNSFGLFVVEK